MTSACADMCKSNQENNYSAISNKVAAIILVDVSNINSSSNNGSGSNDSSSCNSNSNSKMNNSKSSCRRSRSITVGNASNKTNN